MTEIEKMKKYIERTKMRGADNYCLVYSEAIEMLNIGQSTVNGLFDVVSLAFEYGKAKGYRAAKAEGRATV